MFNLQECLEAFKNFQISYPVIGEKIQKELSSLAGDDGRFHYVMIPVGHLFGARTSCGTLDRPHMGFDGTVINFLKKKQIEHVFASVVPFGNQQPIASAVIKLGEHDAEIFSDLVAEANGSLRDDCSSLGEGWSAFESE